MAGSRFDQAKCRTKRKLKARIWARALGGYWGSGRAGRPGKRFGGGLNWERSGGRIGRALERSIGGGGSGGSVARALRPRIWTSIGATSAAFREGKPRRGIPGRSMGDTGQSPTDIGGHRAQFRRIQAKFGSNPTNSWANSTDASSAELRPMLPRVWPIVYNTRPSSTNVCPTRPDLVSLRPIRDTPRPMSAKFGAESAKFGIKSVEFGPGFGQFPERVDRMLPRFARCRTMLGQLRPSLDRNRPNLGRFGPLEQLRLWDHFSCKFELWGGEICALSSDALDQSSIGTQVAMQDLLEAGDETSESSVATWVPARVEPPGRHPQVPS